MTARTERITTSRRERNPEMANFKSGTFPVPVGEIEFSVAGLSLVFAPSSVIVSVRQPSAEADIISAYVIGTPTTDGFRVSLSSPATEGGYLLDYTVFAEGGIAPVDPDSLNVSYADLKKHVAIFLGYDPDALSSVQAAEVDAHIQSGIRNFYFPPKMEGVDENFEWSFIRNAGVLTTAAGVSSYQMPNGFGRIAGQIAVDGEDGFSIPIVPYGDIIRFRQRPRTERPRFAAFIAERVFGSRGQVKRLHLYPTPDRSYDLAFVCDSDSGKLDPENNPFPLGGVMFSELVIESCLAVAEQRSNDDEGLHTKKFNQLLVSAIARDRKSSAQEFGEIGDPEARVMRDFRPIATRGCLY